MLANENQACFIGYGGMLMESFVAIMALVAACIIDPGVYFAMNSPMAVLAPAGTADVVDGLYPAHRAGYKPCPRQALVPHRRGR